MPTWKFRLDSGESWKLKIRMKFKDLAPNPGGKRKQLALVRA
jgi:hypothetical protein